jgi:aldose 1-epimerase
MDYWFLITKITNLSPFNPPIGVQIIRSDNDRLIAWIIPYGARLMQLFLRTTNQWRPLILGFKNPRFYRNDTESIGAICGRYANRIEDGRITNGQQWFELDKNHHLGHCIHGGYEGTGQQNWKLYKENKSMIKASCYLPDGHMGFPGACTIETRYWLIKQTLHFTIDAILSAPCPLNFVQHAYFAWDKPNRYLLQVNAEKALLTNHLELPTFEVDVDSTDTIYKSPKPLTNNGQEQFRAIDRAFRIHRNNRSTEAAKAAILETPEIRLIVSTTEPLIHVYTGQGIKPNQTQALGLKHRPLASVCLESENFPNGPALCKNVWHDENRPYRQYTTWEFQT